MGRRLAIALAVLMVAAASATAEVKGHRFIKGGVSEQNFLGAAEYASDGLVFIPPFVNSTWDAFLLAVSVDLAEYQVDRRDMFYRNDGDMWVFVGSIKGVDYVVYTLSENGKPSRVLVYLKR